VTVAETGVWAGFGDISGRFCMVTWPLRSRASRVSFLVLEDAREWLGLGCADNSTRVVGGANDGVAV